MTVRRGAAAERLTYRPERQVNLFGVGPVDEPWMDDSRCKETDPEAFFPEKGGSTRDAKSVCLTCAVRVECLAYAIVNDERFGIWGGLSERERRRLRARGSTRAQAVAIAAMVVETAKSALVPRRTAPRPSAAVSGGAYDCRIGTCDTSWTTARGRAIHEARSHPFDDGDVAL